MRHMKLLETSEEKAFEIDEVKVKKSKAMTIVLSFLLLAFMLFQLNLLQKVDTEGTSDKNSRLELSLDGR
jgi:hypothetical protein